MSVHDAVGNERITSWTPSTIYNIAAQAVTAGTPVALQAPASGKTVRVVSYHLSLSVAGSVILKDNGNANAEVVRTPLMAAGAGQPAPHMGYGVKLAAANGKLAIDVSATGSVSGWIGVVEE